MTHVQKALATAGAGISSASVSFAATVGGGNLVAGAITWSEVVGLTDISSVTTDKGDSGILLDAIADTANGYALQSFYFPNVTSGAIAVTINFFSSGNFFPVLAIDEYSGVATANPLDGHAISKALQSSSISSATFTPTTNGDLIYGYAADNLFLAISGATGGFTLENNHGDLATEDQVQASAAAIGASFSSSIGSQRTVLSGAMAFKAAAGGGFTPKFGRTLSPLGTRVGSRQAMAA